MSGVIVSNDLMNMLAIFCLTILLTGDILLGDILLAIFLPYTVRANEEAGEKHILI